MNKIYKFKKWFTLCDAAKYLSAVCEGNIDELDILQLAIDREIEISVMFMSPVYARRCDLIHFNEQERKIALETGVYSKGISAFDESDDEFLRMFNLKKPEKSKSLILNPCISKDVFLDMNGPIGEIEGVCDLAMIGVEVLFLKEKIQSKINDNSIDSINLNGTFVRKDGVLMQLQDTVENNPYVEGSYSYVENEKMRIMSVSKGEEYKNSELAKLNEMRRKFLENVDGDERFFCMHGLPLDSNLVITKKSLQDFELKISSSDVKKENSVSVKEQCTLLTIIAAICEHSTVPYDKPDSSKNIQMIIEECGFKMDVDTVRKWIKKIPDAIEGRRKI